jgi:hypothetical protein
LLIVQYCQINQVFGGFESGYYILDVVMVVLLLCLILIPVYYIAHNAKHKINKILDEDGLSKLRKDNNNFKIEFDPELVNSRKVLSIITLSIMSRLYSDDTLKAPYLSLFEGEYVTDDNVCFIVHASDKCVFNGRRNATAINSLVGNSHFLNSILSRPRQKSIPRGRKVLKIFHDVKLEHKKYKFRLIARTGET